MWIVCYSFTHCSLKGKNIRLMHICIQLLVIIRGRLWARVRSIMDPELEAESEYFSNHLLEQYFMIYINFLSFWMVAIV